MLRAALVLACSLAVAAQTCSSYMSCLSCANENACKWSLTNGVCADLTASGESYAATTALCPAAAGVCSSQTSCKACTESMSPICMWSPTSNACSLYSAATYASGSYNLASCSPLAGSSTPPDINARFGFSFSDTLTDLKLGYNLAIALFTSVLFLSILSCCIGCDCCIRGCCVPAPPHPAAAPFVPHAKSGLPLAVMGAFFFYAGSALAFASVAMPWVFYTEQVLTGVNYTDCAGDSGICQGFQALVAGAIAVIFGAFFCAIAALVTAVVACRVHRVSAYSSLKPGSCCGNIPAAAGLGWTGLLLTLAGTIVGWVGFTRLRDGTQALEGITLPTPPGGIAIAIAVCLCFLGVFLTTVLACSLGPLPSINGATPCGCCPAPALAGAPPPGAASLIILREPVNRAVIMGGPGGAPKYVSAAV